MLSTALVALSQNWSSARPLPTGAPAAPLLPEHGDLHPIQYVTSEKKLASPSLSRFMWNVFFKLTVASRTMKLRRLVFKVYPSNCLDVLEWLIVVLLIISIQKKIKN